MKLLQNPYVVGALALVAAAFIYFNVVGPMLKRNAPAPAPAPAVSIGAVTPTPASTETKPKESSPSPTQRKIEPAASIDLNQVGWALNGFPRRDPFQVNTAPGPGQKFTPAMELLTLKAIWRQTGGNLAVINNQIVIPGDIIGDFKIEAIEQDLVWVQGPGGRERVDFKLAPPPKPASP